MALLAPGILVLAGPAGPSGAVLPSQCVTSVNGIDIVCTFTGGPGANWTFTVPNGATSARFRAVGEAGRPSTSGVTGGRARIVEVLASTTPGESIHVALENDGGAPGSFGAGAGGGSALMSRNGVPYMEAAGGGGAGDRAIDGSPGGAGGDAHLPGFDGSGGNANGGGPGTSSSHGQGGAGACIPFPPDCNPPGGAGSAIRGGTGGQANSGGGGGGGGWRTGGGGGAGYYDWGYSAAGGGGGFSLAPVGASQGYATPNETRRVVITFFRAQLVASPDPVTFGNVTVGTTSVNQNVTVRNTGTAPLSLTGTTLSSASFQKTDSCTGLTLQPNATCTIGVRFAPQFMGTVSANLTISSNTMDGSDNVVQLIGTGVQPIASVTPSSLNFGPVIPDTQSPPQTVTMRNTGTANLFVAAVSIVGTNPSEFLLQSTNCINANLVPNGTCTAQVAFKPATTGNRSAALRFVDNAPGSPHEVALAGLGAIPTASVSPSSVDFGDVEIGNASGPSPVTIANTGQVPLNIFDIGVDGANQGDFQVDPGSCAGSIAVGSSCVAQVSFEPQRRGMRNAVLSVTSNASGSPHEVSLQGVGMSLGDLQVRGPGSVFTRGQGSMVTLAVAAGATATYRVKVINTTAVARSFEIALTKNQAASTAKLYNGVLELPKNAAGNYVTGVLQPGKSIIYLLKVKPTDPGQVISGADVHLVAPNGAEHDVVLTETNVRAPSKGTDSFGVFAKAGSQSFIGGSVNDQTTTSNSVALGASTKYTVNLRNDGTAATAMTFKMSAAPNACWTTKATVKQGLATVDITAQATGSGYLTRVIAVNSVLAVTVTMKRLSSSCDAMTWQVSSYDGATPKHFSYLLANPAV